MCAFDRSRTRNVHGVRVKYSLSWTIPQFISISNPLGFAEGREQQYGRRTRAGCRRTPRASARDGARMSTMSTGGCTTSTARRYFDTLRYAVCTSLLLAAHERWAVANGPSPRQSIGRRLNRHKIFVFRRKEIAAPAVEARETRFRGDRGCVWLAACIHVASDTTPNGGRFPIDAIPWTAAIFTRSQTTGIGPGSSVRPSRPRRFPTHFHVVPSRVGRSRL